MGALATPPPYVEYVNDFAELSNFRGSGSFSQKIEYEIVERAAKKSIDSSFLLSLSQFRTLINELRSLESLPKGWNSYGAEQPSPNSVGRAKAFLESLVLFASFPSSITPSAEGGVAILFSGANGHRVLFEFLNCNEDYCLFYNLRGDSQTIVYDSAPDSKNTLLARVAAHLRG
jgi:hypothetical protein